MTSNVSYHLLDKSVVVNYCGVTKTVNSNDPRFAPIVEAIRSKQTDKIPEIVEQNNFKTQSGLETKKGAIWFDGEKIPDALSKRILAFMEQGLPYDPLINFFKRLRNNPSEQSKKQLYVFLENNGHPITEDGYFVAYKSVDSDYKDCYTGKIDNSIGNSVRIDRDKVDPNPNNTCSSGLHVASHHYAKHTYGGAVLLEVKVDPADVVTVPPDYNQQKMRCCGYIVVGNIEHEIRDEVVRGKKNKKKNVKQKKALKTKRKQVQSTALLDRFRRVLKGKLVKYAELRNNNLTVKTSYGAKWRFLDVGVTTANKLLNADDVDKFYKEKIKDKYTKKKV